VDAQRPDQLPHNALARVVAALEVGLQVLSVQTLDVVMIVGDLFFFGVREF
jgi:hypothetical protein